MRTLKDKSKVIKKEHFSVHDGFIDLDVVGGYDDERSLSKEISIKLIKWLFRSGEKFIFMTLLAVTSFH